MKVIKYKVSGLIGKYNYETETVEDVPCLIETIRPFSEENESIAKSEAYNGEYTIEEEVDGK